MDPARLEQRISGLLRELGQYYGYRTIWLDADGSIVTTDPDVELEGTGWRYVATLMQPDRDALTAALLPAIPTRTVRAVVRPALGAELVPPPFSADFLTTPAAGRMMRAR